jgi:hypothetical protein
MILFETHAICVEDEFCFWNKDNFYFSNNGSVVYLKYDGNVIEDKISKDVIFNLEKILSNKVFI